MHFDLMCLPLPLQQAPFPFAKIVSQQRCHTKPSDSPLPTHPHMPVIILSRVWGVADSLVQSSPPQTQIAAEARNTWTL